LRAMRSALVIVHLVESGPRVPQASGS
jgi:hypothetical protein